MASEDVSEQKRSRMEERKKKSDANVNRKFGIMKWSHSPGKRWEYFVMEGGRSCVPHKDRENVFGKTKSNDRLLPIKTRGRQRMDAEINK